MKRTWYPGSLREYFGHETEAAGSVRLLERHEIDKAHTWAVEAIFSADQEWEAELAAVTEAVKGLRSFQGTLAQGPAHLHEVLEARDRTQARVERLYVYASLLADQDTRVGRHQAMRSRARALAVSYDEAISWLDPELLAISEQTIKKWMAEHPPLALYQHALDDLYRRKPFILTPREEELLAMCGEVRAVPYTAYGLLAHADLKFPTITDEKGRQLELNDSSFYVHMRSPDRSVRKDAYYGIVGTFAGVRNTVAALLSGAVHSHILSVKARRHPSCLAAALHESNIPIEVYETLIRAVNDRLPLLHRYQQMRKQVLNLEDGVHAYDTFAPLAQIEAPGYTFEEAVDWVGNALRPLGEEYGSAMRRGFKSRWVDVFPTRGKRSGAYSSGSYLTQPYILLNFHGGFEDVSTLAHEMGHSMHSHFSRGSQPYVYANYDIFCAEVASICNELLLQHYILERTNDRMTRLYLLGEFLEGFLGTVLRQTMFSEFEQRIHGMAEEGEPLTADALGEVFRELQIRYYGPAYAHDDLVDEYWIRIPHFYYNFYVYKYATSYCAASSIVRRILDGQAGAREAYLDFLKAGGSDYPVPLLQRVGVDMTRPDPVYDALSHFERLLDQAADLIGETATSLG